MKTKVLVALIMSFTMAFCACSGSAKNSNPSDANKTETTQNDSQTNENPVEAIKGQVEEGINNVNDSLNQPVLEFSGKDLDGNTISRESLAGNKLVMLNFWESWCGPCIREMPEIQKLYEDYKDQGFTVLGVYSTPGDEENVKAVVEQTGVKYPTIYITESMIRLMTGAVPTTYFLDGEGRILNFRSPAVGSNDYQGWEEVIKSYLN